MDRGFLDFEHLIALMPGHIFWLDREGIYRGCNDLQAKANGLRDRNEVIGKRNRDLPIHKDQHELVEFLDQINLKVMETATPITIEEPAVYGGKSRVYLSHKVPLFDVNKNVIGLLGISFDISETKNEFLELKAKQAKTELTLENIIANLPGHIYWVDTDNCFLGCNEQQARAFGLKSADQIAGLSVRSFQTSENADTIIKNNNRVIKRGEIIIEEESFVDQQGVQKVFLSKKVPFKDKDEHIIGLLGISLDITDKKKTEQELQETRHKLVERMTVVSASIAHELRTPLATIAVGAGSIGQYIPPLVESYIMALKANLPVPKLDLGLVEYLKAIPQSLIAEANAGNVFIDMLLQNIKPTLAGEPSQTFAISTCIQEAITRYPFIDNQRELVIWHQAHDFMVRGKEDKLIVHVLFNLIKNALFYVADAGKGNIQLWLEPGEPYNRLFFQDTGKGIAADVLPQVFERFFSQTRNGAGVGLTFCRMVMENLGGSITCESELGNYTQFILSFPNID